MYHFVLFCELPARPGASKSKRPIKEQKSLLSNSDLQRFDAIIFKKPFPYQPKNLYLHVCNSISDFTGDSRSVLISNQGKLGLH